MAAKRAGPRKTKPAAKAEFSTRGLQTLIRKINDNPELLEEPWPDVVRGHFRLPAEEEESLAETHPRKVKMIQKFVDQCARHIREGGTVTGKLVKRDIEEQKDGLVYDIALDMAPPAANRRRK